MLLLTSTSDTLAVVTGSAVTGIDVHASWVDLSGTTVTPGRTNTVQITAAATTTVVAAPASSTARNVKFLSIRNTNASSSNTITVQHFDGTTTTTLYKITLKAGYTLTFDGNDWITLDASGGRTETPLQGRYLGSTVLTAASGTFTTGPETNTIRIRGVGGGGGGGGCTSVASAASAGGGGGAGSYLEKTVTVTPNTGYAYVCGALGAGASGALGGSGASSTFIVGATTYTAPGGTGAPVATAVTTIVAYPGGAGGAVATNGDANGGGEAGQTGLIYVAAGAGVSGAGGAGPFGGGGAAIAVAGNGNAGTGHGSGGGGALTGASAARTGGSGTGGMWVVDEFS